jgi:hypothetical protein
MKDITVMDGTQNAEQLESEFSNVHVLSVYRDTTGGFELFLMT